MYEGGRARERGATTVEYALVVALLVLGVVASLTTVEDESRDYYSQTADDIGELPYETTTSTTPPGTTTTATPGTTTTAPPPPTVATTTTTAPTTTTTTAPALESTIDRISDLSYDQTSTYWAARARFYIETTAGDPVSGATVSTSWVDGNRTTASGSCTTGSSGYCQLTWYYRRWYDNPVTVTITDVDATPAWDESAASQTLWRP